MNVRFEITGVKQVKVYIDKVASGVSHIAINAVARLFKVKLKVDQPYKYASRAGAYGYTGAKFENGRPVPAGYFSAKQFRYVAYITHGFTDRGSKRTGKSSAAWTYKDISAGDKTGYIMNPSPGAYFTRSDYGQARQPADVGWKRVSIIIAENIAEASRAAIAAVNAYLKQSK